MLDEIEEEELNPLNIETDPTMKAAEKERSIQLQLEKIYDTIEEKRYGLQGKPK